MAHGCASIFVANRTYERAIGLAQKFNGQAIKFEDLYATCDRADIVITSTGAPHAIFRREHGEQFLARRKNRPMFFIDIAVPRDVSPGDGQARRHLHLRHRRPAAGRQSATSPTAARKPNSPKPSSPAKSSASKPACKRSTWCRQLCRYKIIWKRFARQKSIACAAAWAS